MDSDSIAAAHPGFQNAIQLLSEHHNAYTQNEEVDDVTLSAEVASDLFMGFVLMANTMSEGLDCLEAQDKERDKKRRLWRPE